MSQTKAIMLSVNQPDGTAEVTGPFTDSELFTKMTDSDLSNGHRTYFSPHPQWIATKLREGKGHWLSQECFPPIMTFIPDDGSQTYTVETTNTESKSRRGRKRTKQCILPECNDVKKEPKDMSKQKQDAKKYTNVGPKQQSPDLLRGNFKQWLEKPVNDLEEAQKRCKVMKQMIKAIDKTYMTHVQNIMN